MAYSRNLKGEMTPNSISQSRPNTADRQVADDPALLDLMMTDLSQADGVFRPTSYWAYYESRVVAELRRHGLRDFRNRRDSWGGAFGSVEVMPPAFFLNLDGVRLLSNKYSRRLLGWRDFLVWLSRRLSTALNALPHRLAFEMSLLDMQLLTFEYVKAVAQARGARPPTEFGVALWGNPGDRFQVGDHTYTMQFLKFFWRYTFAAQFVDFSQVRTIVELGSGMGSQAEIFRKLYPDKTILLFDIPPQLYVAERYLSTVFPGDVVSFRTARDMHDLKTLERGKIYILGSWQVPMIADITVDLFWNARSLGEMEPEIAANYMRFATASSRYIYLNQVLGGQTLLSAQGPGVRRRTLWSDYETALADRYDLAGRCPSLYPSSPSTTRREYNSYADEAVWRRRRPTVGQISGEAS